MAVEITTWAELAAINSALSGDYILMNDLDKNSVGYNTYASSSANGGAGWTPIGPNTGTSSFKGHFNGNFHIISDVVSTYKATKYVGLFGYTNGSKVENLLLDNITITTAKSYVGAMVGMSTSEFYRCGVLGGTITNTLTATGGFGGTIGTGSVVEECFTRAYVNGGSFAGGFAGNPIAQIKNCYSVRDVSGSSQTAGFSGNVQGGTIEKCYSLGRPTGGSTGGFCMSSSGALVGIDNFYCTATTLKTDSYKATGLGTISSLKKASYTNWDFDNVWMIEEGQGFPRLQWEKNIGAVPPTPPATPQAFVKINGVKKQINLAVIKK